MAIVPMQKVAVLAHRSLADDLLRFLQDRGVMEVVKEEGIPFLSSHTLEKADIEAAYQKAEVEFAIDYLSAYGTENAEKKETEKSPEEIEEEIFKTDFRSLINRVKEIEKEKVALLKEKSDLEGRREFLLPWREYPNPGGTKNKSNYIEIALGKIPKTAAEEFRNDLSKKNIKAEVTVVSEGEEELLSAIYIWREDKQSFDELAVSHSWEEVHLNLSEGKTVKEEVNECEKAAKKAQQGISQLEEELREHAQNIISLRRLNSYLGWLEEEQKVRESAGYSRETVTITGWVPQKEISALEKGLKNLSPATLLLTVAPQKGEEPPVLVRNELFLSPFESVTNLYGLPLPSEFDPTVSLAPFFILFFALCLTDAGYGLILALVFGAVIWKQKKKIRESPLLWLLFYGGMITFLVGIPFGGWWGLSPEQVPSLFTKTGGEGEKLFLGQIWNLSTRSGVTFLQNLSLGLGITHLFYGMFLAGYHKWIHGKKKEALWKDYTSNLLLVAGLFAFFAPPQLAEISRYFLYATLALFLWGKGYGTSLLMRPLAGLLGLITFAISLLSNSLSYLRILALGLVTGAIAMAVNQVAVEIGNLLPLWAAIPIIVVVFVGGHLVSIALNTLGSFIHSGRLQFIEFFSQFFEGGGRMFQPFRRS